MIKTDPKLTPKLSDKGKKLDSKKGNNGGGRKLKYPTPDDLQAVLNEYFTNTPKNEWTITGLSLEVGSKQLLNDYADRPEYSQIVHYAKLMVENSYELSLRNGGGAGNIFALKNFGWTDKQEIDMNASVSVSHEDALKELE